MGSNYQSIERVFRLLLLLNTAPGEGFSREEVFAQIGLYDTDDITVLSLYFSLRGGVCLFLR